MCYMKNFDINELNGLDYESGKKLLLNAGYSQKMGKENYEPCIQVIIIIRLTSILLIMTALRT